jgi:metallo-beta-lactamase class B
MRVFATTLASLIFLTNIYSQAANNNLKITHLTGDFYVYTTYNGYKGNRIGANAMYLVTNKGVVLFDTP